MSSTSNFLTGLAVAQLSGPAEFGRYMLMLMVWLVTVGAHRALVTEPLIVTSRKIADDRELTARGLSAELLLGIAISALLATGGLVTLAAGARIAIPMLALTPWLIPLLVQDYWRGVSFNQRRPGLALANDVIFAVVQVTAIALFSLAGWRTAAHMITAWGLGAATGALLGFWLVPGAGRPRRGWAFLSGAWPLSRSMLADFLTSFASHQAYLAFAALLLSQVDYGGFRAALNLMGPVIIVLHAGANIGLPEASRRFDPEDPSALRRFARHLTAGTFLCVAIYAGVVAIGGGRLLGFVFGPAFGSFGQLATLAALQYVIAVSWFGQGIALKAAGRMRRLWRARLVVAAASLVLLVVFVHWLGTVGAGWAGVMTDVAYACAVHAIYRAELGRKAGGGDVPDGLTPEWEATFPASAAPETGG